MALATGKRKREAAPPRSLPVKKPALGSKIARSPGETQISPVNHPGDVTANGISNGTASSRGTASIQIVTGSYERVLHGLSARIPYTVLASERREPEASATSTSDGEHLVDFSDTFLFAAHASAIRCLAISPPTEEADKRYLATGSSDERINVYSLSTAPLSTTAHVVKPNLPSLAGTATAIAENSRNRSLGSLVHHDRAITRLQFSSRSKLFSAAGDATIAISRTRDWTVLSSIKAPIPKPQGRPSGDTAAPGEIPAGVNDFSIHPSQKVMLSVGRGEKCMRMWNLMTGKKAAVLNFDRELLAAVEASGRLAGAGGEGLRVLFHPSGERYVVGFERGAVLFNLDAKPQGILKPSPPSKLHQMRYVPLDSETSSILAVSLEDGRIVFFDALGTSDGHLVPCKCIAQLGGSTAGVQGRIKDFEIVRLAGESIIVTGSSDGAIRLWIVRDDEFVGDDLAVRQIGRLVATHETGNRITCLGAFVLDGKVKHDTDVPIDREEDLNGEEEEDDDDDDDDDDDEKSRESNED